MNKFYRGQFVTYNEHSGYVNFISEEYITICVKEYTKPPQEAQFSRCPVRQVCLCVYSRYWDNVIPTPQEVINTFSTENAEIVENIK